MENLAKTVEDLFASCERQHDLADVTVKISGSSFSFSQEGLKNNRSELLAMIHPFFKGIRPGERFPAVLDLAARFPITFSQLVKLVAMGEAIGIIKTFFGERDFQLRVKPLSSLVP